ncbi:ORF6N domain-containing protein [Pedobacter endophyticus]|uniref:ORF6N domain-containing protein n=1 Tax=Pedobacter endophyticus TaxID=2789740 RepID=A0A7S9Q0V6_9SPHI|nr:ORF6N domain-containing protein [Pedobacter endophyticus]QPH41181.1 ORF6N domain-containing protein [Pedobacter endophyticus]
MQIIKSIESRIYTVRGERVMLDFDLAALYEVETRVLNQAVKRNEKRFPDDFMFQLTSTEWESMQSQFVTAYEEISPSSQIVMMNIPQNRTGKYLPYAFTEQGVAMLSGVLRSDKAIKMNIAIMRAFVAIRKIFLQPNDDNERLKEIKERIEEHDIQLNQLYDAMDNLLDERIAQKKWNDRKRIGFKIKE